MPRTTKRSTRKTTAKTKAKRAPRKRPSRSRKQEAEDPRTSYVIEPAVEIVPVSSLEPHPELKAIVPEADEDSRAALVQDMTARHAAGLVPNTYPLIVTEDDKVVDGMTRLMILQTLKVENVAVQRVTGNAEQVRFAGVSLNTDRRQLTTQARKAMAAGYLKADPESSDRTIARATGLSPATVGKIRTAEGAESDTRRGKGGRKQSAGSAKRKKAAKRKAGSRRGPKDNGSRKPSSGDVLVSLMGLKAPSAADVKTIREGANKTQTRNLNAWAKVLAA